MMIDCETRELALLIIVPRLAVGRCPTASMTAAIATGWSLMAGAFKLFGTAALNVGIAQTVWKLLPLVIRLIL